MRTDTMPSPPRVCAATRWRAVARLVRDARARAPVLWTSGVVALAVSLPLLVLAWFDPRVLNGVSVWIKPWKFHVSVGVHLLTLALAAAMLPETARNRLRLRGVAIVAVSCALGELAYITVRAGLGLHSHFDIGSTFSSVMYGLMGLGAVGLTACAGLLGWWISREHAFAHGAVVQRGVAWGLMLGALLGTLAGGYLSAQGGHWVGGTPSDAGGSWLFHWSRDGGDLRVAHFFGLHAMQVLPLAAWAFARTWRPPVAMRALTAFSAGYVLLVVATFVQALAGRPFPGG
ncbi:MAG: hypothetical protein AB7P21_10240 [Lautropia sp.]